MRIESRIQMGGEKEAVVDVQTLGVGFTICPRDDVARAQEPGVADSSDCAGSIPEQHQRFAEHLLAYAFLSEPLYLGCARWLAKPLPIPAQRRVGQAASKAPDHASGGAKHTAVRNLHRPESRRCGGERRRLSVEIPHRAEMIAADTVARFRHGQAKACGGGVSLPNQPAAHSAFRKTETVIHGGLFEDRMRGEAARHLSPRSAGRRQSGQGAECDTRRSARSRCV